MFSIAKLGVSFRHFLQWIMHSSALYSPSVCIWLGYVCVCVPLCMAVCVQFLDFGKSAAIVVVVCDLQGVSWYPVLAKNLLAWPASQISPLSLSRLVSSRLLSCSHSHYLCLCLARSYRTAGKWMHLYLIKIFYLLHCKASPGVASSSSSSSMSAGTTFYNILWTPPLPFHCQP